MPWYMMAWMGSGFMSTTTEAVAVYCLGMSRLTARAATTASTRIDRATFQRARRMPRNCWKFMACLPPASSEDAFAHVDHVAIAQPLVHARLDHLHLAIAAAAVHAHAALGAALGQ